MNTRLAGLNAQFSAAPTAAKGQPTLNVWDSMGLNKHIRPSTVEKRTALSKALEAIYPDLTSYINKCEFPFWVLPKLKSLGITGLQVKDFGGPGFSNVESGSVIYELAKYDACLATFYVVHNGLGINTIDFCGDEEQRKRLLPGPIALDKVLCWGLTEPDYGSDATSLKTVAKKVDGGYLITGEKRWIGNASFADYLVIWARNEAEGGKIQAFVVTKGSKGLSTSVIQNKYALRMVQNANIYLKDVFVPDNNRLNKAQSFQSGTAPVLEASRLLVAWIAAGTAAGAYEAALKYCLKRKQFGKPIAKFQLIQEKLSRMLALCEMMNSNLIMVSQAMDRGEATMGMVGRTKGINSLLGRQVVALAREVCGGNGIVLDNHVMKQFMDMEAIYTYEGTYEINALVSGRELTGGLAAFK